MSKRESLARVMMKTGLLPVSARLIARDLTVLAFHRVGTPQKNYTGDHSLFSVSREQFQNLMENCKRRFSVTSLSQVAQTLKAGKSFSRPTVAITFDDGYIDNYSDAAAILTDLGLPATFFICPGLIDDPHSRWWDTVAALVARRDKLKELGYSDSESMLTSIKSMPHHQTQSLLCALREYSRLNLRDHAQEMMNWEMVRDLHRRGFEIGAHSLTHRVLSTLSPAEQQFEIFESKQLLELHLGAPVTSFAYPVGGPAHYQEETRRLVQEAGFECAVTYGLNKSTTTSSTPNLAIPRLAAAGSADLIFGSIVGLWAYDQ